jgi:hypothetical protein
MYLKQKIPRSSFLSFFDDFRYAGATIVALCSQGLSSKCVDNRDIRMNKHKNLTFRLILRKKILGPSRFEPTKKLHSGLYPVNRMSNQLNKISPLSFFSRQLNANKRFSDKNYLRYFF